MLAGFVSQEAVLVQVHHQELVKLHVLMALQGRAVAGPAEPLQVDAEALWQLRAEGKGKAQAVQRPTARLLPSRPQVQEPTFPSFNCLTKVVLWCSTFSPFSVPFASICNKATACLQEPAGTEPAARELRPQLKSVHTSLLRGNRNHGGKTKEMQH